MPRRPARPAATLAAAALLLGACEYDRTVIGQGQPQLAVHAVLNPGAPDVVVLVEQVLTGRASVAQSSSFDPQSPIRSGGGIPVVDARVWLYGPEPGDSARALPGAGQGVYRATASTACAPQQTSCIVLTPGRTYRLRVLAGAAEVTGETTIPRATPRGASPISARPFDREADTLAVAWRRTALAHRYALRIQSPRGPYNAFLSDTAVAVAGTLRNPLERTLPAVFMPGFVQEVAVAAVDSNFYDFFRSSNNPFTGTGLIDRLEGGVGVFGSWLLLEWIAVSVAAPVDEPIEGRYTRATPGFLPPDVRLWVESRAAGVTYLSGRYVADGEGSPRGLLGLVAGRQVTLAFLQGQLASDTAFVFRAELQPDGSIAGAVAGRGTQRLLKQP